MTISFNLPAEWANQSAVVIAWPHEGTDWAARLGEVEKTYIALVAAITRFEKVLICVADGALQGHAEGLLQAAQVDMQQVQFVQVEYDDTWLRDTGPITLQAGSRFKLLDFRFTGWGGKFEASRDDELAGALFKKGLFNKNAELESIDFALEGGAIDSDGAGSLLTTWKCLNERHPDSSREVLSAQLAKYLCQDRVLWLDHGYLEGDDTDAHIDTLARFTGVDGITYQACDDVSDVHYAELDAMGAEIAALRTISGEAYKLYPLPWAQPVLDEGRRLAASYANFLILNGAVLMPAYGDVADGLAAEVLGRAFPGREIIAIPCRSLIWQNGSLHCITMQLPAGVLA